ncbi:hypothetical protein RI367_008742 [Sorochytrium milnesiophthora]
MTEIVDGHRVRGEQLVRHAGLLVGKDFRGAAAELTRMLYYPRVPLSHLQQWVQKLRDLVYRYISTTQQLETGNLLDFDANQATAGQASAAAAPRPRLNDHLLLHIPDLVEYWGPLRFESANGDIRAAISHTSSHAISRDGGRFFAFRDCASALAGGANWMLNGARVAAQLSVENSFSGAKPSYPQEVNGYGGVLKSWTGAGTRQLLLRGDEDVIVELLDFREEDGNVNVVCREWVKQDSWDLLGYVHLMSGMTVMVKAVN